MVDRNSDIVKTQTDISTNMRNWTNRKFRSAGEERSRKKCKVVEKEMMSGKADVGYRNIMQNFDKKIKTYVSIHSKNGKPLLRKEERAGRWQEYIEGLNKGQKL